MTIRLHIILLWILATTGLLGGMGFVCLNDYRLLTEKQGMLPMLDRETLYSDLVHELQRERGLSAGTLTAFTSDNRNTLAEQMRATDAVIERMSDDERRALPGLALLGQMRESISKDSATANNSFEYYTSLIMAILDHLLNAAKNSNASLFRNGLYAHVQLMLAKEQMGQIRARLNESFFKHEVDIQNLIQVSQSLALFRYHNAASINNSPPEIATAYRDIINHSNMLAVHRIIESVLLNKAADLQAISPKQWWATASAAIDLLKALEDRSIEQIHQQANRDIALSQQQLNIHAGGALLLASLIAVVAILASQRVIKALNTVLGNVRAIMDSSNFSNRISLSSRDEMGTIARYFNELLTLAEKLISEKDLLASIDPLTGAYNRYRFADIFNRDVSLVQRYKGELGLLMFDLDHFKTINDTYGHAAGDMVLRETTLLVRANIRASDALARWGGEEFVVLVPAQDHKAVSLLAEKLRAQIESYVFTDVPVGITASFGITTYVVGETLEQFCARADEALYRAKITGRNRVCGNLASSHLPMTTPTVTS